MSELIPDARELARTGDLNSLKQYFNESTRLAWNEVEIKELVELYDIAVKEDSEDPVKWITSFDRSYPRKLDVGSPNQRRLGKILFMVKLYLERKDRREQRTIQKERNF